MKCEAILLIFLASTLAGCPGTGGDPHVPAPNPPPDSDLIGEMCAHLKRLNCEEGEGVYNDSLPGEVDVPNQSCTEYYKEMQELGVFANPKCVSLVKKCSEIEDARAKDPKTCGEPSATE